MLDPLEVFNLDLKHKISTFKTMKQVSNNKINHPIDCILNSFPLPIIHKIVLIILPYSHLSFLNQTFYHILWVCILIINYWCFLICSIIVLLNPIILNQCIFLQDWVLCCYSVLFFIILPISIQQFIYPVFSNSTPIFDWVLPVLLMMAHQYWFLTFLLIHQWHFRNFGSLLMSIFFPLIKNNF